MSQAKHLHGKPKTDATKLSYENKLAHMSRALKVWKKQGYRGDERWPTSLSDLAEWNEPDKGIFSWVSTNVTKRDNKNYSELTKRYWALQLAAEPHLADTPGDTHHKRVIVKIAEENARLLWANMELRSALQRVDPKNPILDKIVSP